jgi:hypothetical protein
MISLVLVFYGVCRSLHSTCGQKRGNGQNAYQAPGLVLDRTRSAIECTVLKRPKTRSSMPALKPRKQQSNPFMIERETHDRVHSTSATKPALP